MTSAIDLSFIVPGSNENRWSDLLATLATTDAQPLSELLSVEFDEVEREVSVTGETKRVDRLDLLLRRAGDDVAVIEVKLLSDLGPDQLNRYLAAFPGAETYRVLHLRSMGISQGNAAPWQSLTWEDVLDAHSRSTHAWVAATAQAWAAQLEQLVPMVGPETVWNDVPDDPAGLELHLRARIAWLSNRLATWCELDHDMCPASGGGNWSLRVWSDSSVADHVVAFEIQEGLTAFEWKVDKDKPYRERLPGPVGLLGLRHASRTSESFNWGHLHTIFKDHVLGEDGLFPDDRNWQSTSARPKHPVDKEGWATMIDAGAPRSLGKGWGMRDAIAGGECVFGARYQLPPTATLAEVEVDVREMIALITTMGSGSA